MNNYNHSHKYIYMQIYPQDCVLLKPGAILFPSYKLMMRFHKCIA